MCASADVTSIAIDSASMRYFTHTHTQKDYSRSNLIIEILKLAGALDDAQEVQQIIIFIPGLNFIFKGNLIYVLANTYIYIHTYFGKLNGSSLSFVRSHPRCQHIKKLFLSISI